MSVSVFQRESEESDESIRSEPTRTSVAGTTPFRIGRLLYGGVLAIMALDNFSNLSERIDYAESQGVPAPDYSVPLISGALLSGSLGVVLWRVPVLAASAIATFFAATTPVMHDFWNVEDPQQRQQQQFHFLKNLALLGASIAFLIVGSRSE